MKIAQICPRYFPNIGGIETHVMEISQRLTPQHEVEVICADLLPGLSKTEYINGVKITRFQSFIWRDFLYFSPGINSHFKKNKYDIVHIHNYHAFPALFASFALPNNFIFTPYYHGKGSTFFTNLLLKPYHYLGKWIFHRAKKIICISEYEKYLVIKDFHIDSDKISVIPSGIDLNAIHNSKSFDSPKKLILSIGRLDKYKNLDLIIKAISFLPDFNFYIIGQSGNYKKEIFHLIESLNLTTRVKILDHVSDEEKYRWLKTCDLFINLSDTESFGITVLEALAAGKSIIVNNTGALQEFVDKYDDEVIGIDIHQLKDENTFIDFANLIKSRSGLEYRHDLFEYGWNIILQKIEQEYHEVLSQ